MTLVILHRRERVLPNIHLQLKKSEREETSVKEVQHQSSKSVQQHQMVQQQQSVQHHTVQQQQMFQQHHTLKQQQTGVEIYEL